MDSWKKPGTFQEFQTSLRTKTSMDARSDHLHELYRELKQSSPEHLLEFGVGLHRAIDAHDRGDSLATAHAEGRVAYRSWHDKGAAAPISPEEDPSRPDLDLKRTVHTRVGFDALNAQLDPKTFQSYKQRYRSGEKDLDPVIEAPSTLLRRKETSPHLFARAHATTTALLPEEHYAAFFAYNEAVKRAVRKHQPVSGESGSNESPPGREQVEALAQHAKYLRASVTRPTYFDNDDIGSYTYAHARQDPNPSLQVRKGHAGMETPLAPGSGFKTKLADPRRRNALFYQSFMGAIEQKEALQKTQSSRHSWNEMIVKFRQTGHTAALGHDAEKLESVVPALAGRASLDLSPSTSDADSYRQNSPRPVITHEFAQRPLPSIQTKPKGKGKGKGGS